MNEERTLSLLTGYECFFNIRNGRVVIQFSSWIFPFYLHKKTFKMELVFHCQTLNDIYYCDHIDTVMSRREINDLNHWVKKTNFFYF